MLKDILEVLQEIFRRVINSRLFFLGLIFLCMGGVLITKLFNLQIIEGEDYLNEYVQMTERTISTPGTRGNIYDSQGNLLAYNELAYSVSIQDAGVYRTNADMNAMLLKLVEILDGHGYSVQGRLEIAFDPDGDLIYTSNSEAARKRFLRDYYGRRSVDELDDEKGRYPSAITAREIFEQRKERYELDKMKDDKGNPLIISEEVMLKIMDIRYTMSLTSFKRYETATITSYIDEETVVAIREHSAELKGVSVEQSTIRKYNDSIYFASIIGYTGKVQEDQLEELQKVNSDYDLNDIVGRIGIESSMEYELQGSKGRKDIIVDNLGNIMKVNSEIEPGAGNDIYLTLDRKLQIGIYHLLEQQLAGILADKLVNLDADMIEETDSSKMKIPIKDAYYQLINNNILSIKEMEREDASAIEQEIYQNFSSSRSQIINNMRNELNSDHASDMKDLSPSMMAYMVYAYTYLSDPTIGIIQKDLIDVSSAEYQAWKNDEISLRDYIYYGISNNWIDTTRLNVENRYSSADDIYGILVEYLLDHLNNDTKFSKRIFRYLINDGVITGRQLCLALYSQGVLTHDEEQIQMLSSNGENYAYTFMIDKISTIQITPAQLALDPCTSGCVITDVNTGEVKAIVSYPSYDNNRLSGTVDAVYYNQLQEDLSLPLYNNATQARKAPGSTFKPLTAIAGLEEGVISLTDTINCTGVYDLIEPPIRCWTYPNRHNELNVRDGIKNSCNYFFAEVAHRLSTDDNDDYSPDRGVAYIQKYAAMFGLDRPSGIEISENPPQVTTEAPERSAMGQGTNSYSNVQLSRYVSALANRGTVYELSLLDKMTDAEGNLLKDYTPEIHSQIEIADSTWDVVAEGMRAVVVESSARNVFYDLEVEIAGKTGTAQESKTRGNHAFFISYGPYQKPDISVTVNIPYGYSSTNAATVTKNIYRFYYGYTDLDYIQNTGALDVANVTIGD